MRKRWRVAIVGVVFGAAVLRLSVVWRQDPVIADDRAMTALDLAGGLPYCFDDDAPVLLGVGDDGAPGIAGEDDNRNGVVDERREHGAVGSDDVCLAPQDAEYAKVQEHPDTIVISRGAFVRCQESVAADRALVEGFGWVV